MRFLHYDVLQAVYDVNYFGDKGLGVRGVYVMICASQTQVRSILAASEDEWGTKEAYAIVKQYFKNFELWT